MVILFWLIAREDGRMNESFGSWGRGPRPKGICEERDSRKEPCDRRFAKSWSKNSSRFSSTLKLSAA